MSEPIQKPVIFLAFAQDRVEGGAHLRNLPIEPDGIRKAPQKARQAGLSIDRAWAEAVDQIKVEKGTSNTRALHRKGKVEASDRFPWEIYYRQGAEIVKDWNLPKAVENPLFGLPDIPKTYDLPETPFLFLKRYEREHAEIFFGRSYCIRELYNRVSDPNSPPVILLYGQSGVGKSSLFDAGLNPRLEKEYKVIYIRRIQERGLAGTLEYALKQEHADPTEMKQPATVSHQPPAEESSEAREALTYLEAAAGKLDPKSKQEVEALIQRLKSTSAASRMQQPSVLVRYPSSRDEQPAAGDRQPASEIPNPQSDILVKWQHLEAQSGKALIVILDQVEELFTRPNNEFPDELADLLLALRNIFGSPPPMPVQQVPGTLSAG